MAEAARRQAASNGEDPSQSGWGSPSRTHGVGVRDPKGAWVKTLGQLVEMITGAMSIENPEPGIFVAKLAHGYEVYPARLRVSAIPATYFDRGLVSLQRFDGPKGATIKAVLREALPQELATDMISVRLDVDAGYRMWIAGLDEALSEEESAVVIYKRASPPPPAPPAQKPVFKKYGFGAPRDLDMLSPQQEERQHSQPQPQPQRRRFTPNARRAVKK